MENKEITVTTRVANFVRGEYLGRDGWADNVR